MKKRFFIFVNPVRTIIIYHVCCEIHIEINSSCKIPFSGLKLFPQKNIAEMFYISFRKICKLAMTNISHKHENANLSLSTENRYESVPVARLPMVFQ